MWIRGYLQLARNLHIIPLLGNPHLLSSPASISSSIKLKYLQPSSKLSHDERQNGPVQSFTTRQLNHGTLLCRLVNGERFLPCPLPHRALSSPERQVQSTFMIDCRTPQHRNQLCQNPAGRPQFCTPLSAARWLYSTKMPLRQHNNRCL